MLEEASRYLAEAQRFPATEPIAALLEEHKLLHVYNPQTINRAIIDILERADCLEVLSGIDVMLPTRVDADPDVLSERTGSLREALELTLLHAALAVRECDPELVNVVIAGNLVSSNIEITFDLEAITSAEEVLSFEDFRQTLRSAESVDAFWQNLPPVTIWTHAKEATEFALAIGLEAQRLRRIAGAKRQTRIVSVSSLDHTSQVR